MNLDIVNYLVKGKKAVWNFKFQQAICGRKASLGGLSNKSLVLRLETSKDYPNMDIKAFLNWDKWDQFTDKEKELALILEKEIKAKNSSS